MYVSKLNKMQEFLLLLGTHPLEAYDRAATVLEVQADRLLHRPPAYRPERFDTVTHKLEQIFSSECEVLLQEAARVEEQIHGLQQRLTTAPIRQIHNADFILARLCYVTCRMVRPTVVLETGVAYGVTSAFILSALEANGHGTLHSVDLPPLGPDVDRYVGALIPEHLKHRWQLHRGVTKRILPALLPRLEQVDVFVHDSLHTFRNIRRELQMVRPYLSPRAVVLADDVDENRAFLEWTRQANPSFSATLKEKDKGRLLGIGVMGNAHTARS